jgi:riboflavin biosynthesis pyrimidine reductase
MTAISRLWPEPSGPLDDDALRDCYAYPAGDTLRVNFVTSADGAATVDGRSGPLGGPGDRRIFDLLRAGCDALLVGANTVRTEHYDALRPDPEWRKAGGRPAYPIMSILSRSLDLDPEQLVFTDAPRPPIVFTGPGAGPARLPAEVIIIDDLVGAVTRLREKGAANILCEGGPSVFGQLIAGDLVDELCLTVAPLLAGGSAGRVAAGPPTEAREMSLRHVLTDGRQLFLRYVRKQPLVDKPVDDH